MGFCLFVFVDGVVLFVVLLVFVGFGFSCGFVVVGFFFKDTVIILVVFFYYPDLPVKSLVQAPCLTLFL